MTSGIFKDREKLLFLLIMTVIILPILTRQKNLLLCLTTKMIIFQKIIPKLPVKLWRNVMNAEQKQIILFGDYILRKPNDDLRWLTDVAGPHY